MDCPDCEFVAKTAGGLASHRKAKHRDTPTGANLAAIEVTLAELKRMGRLEAVDTARVVALRSMAAALDLNPFNSQMWREYREALEGLTADGADDGSVEALLAELSSPVRDEKAS